MSFANVSKYLTELGLGDKIIVFDQSSATVELAAEAVGCKPQYIAKTMSFLLSDDEPILIVVAGDAKVDNKKFKDTFHCKAKMIPYDKVESYIGHAPGGVCPFATKKETSVYLDVSLKRFEKVYPAAGSDNSAVELTIPELKRASHAFGWVNVCNSWE